VGNTSNDLLRLDLNRLRWSADRTLSREGPEGRFCHVACVDKGKMYVFGGHNGDDRLNDLVCIDLTSNHVHKECSLTDDLRAFVNNPVMSDIIFQVGEQKIYAHKVLCLRCQYFRAMLLGDMKESKQHSIQIMDIDPALFLLVMEFLYSDTVDVPQEEAFNLMEVAGRLSIGRLQDLCERKVLATISEKNAPSYLFLADKFNFAHLREECLAFLVAHFDSSSVTEGFKNIMCANPDLIMEVLQRRVPR